MDEKVIFYKSYDYLRERVIDKYDYYYHEELLEDIGSVGEVDYLIGDESEFLYNVWLGRDIKDTIDVFINEEGNYDLLLKLIELKKITDKRILSNPKYDENYVNEIVFDIKNTTEKNTSPKAPINKFNPIIKLNPSIKNKEELLKEIFSFLNKEGYIECSEDVFNSHFKPSKEWSTKILWLGNLISLVGLVDDLFIKNILPIRRKRRLRNKTVLNHFKSEKGDLKEGSVKTEGTNIFDTKRYKEIHEFITSLKVDFD